jgi:large subunit ribosomal protein L21e
MVKKSHGPRARTRKKLKQKLRRKGITRFLKEFKEGQKVMILQEPASHKGMPFPRFKGKIGKVINKRGRSYIVEVLDGKKVKKIISRPEHLKAI